MIAYALDHVDEVWMVPTFVHRFGKHLTSYDDRFAMCALVAAGFGPRVSVSRIEEELARAPDFIENRTLDTINALRQRHGDVAFRLLIGADILGETTGWYRWDEVAKAAPPLVLGRDGYASAGTVDAALPPISSTEVRTRIAHEGSARGTAAALVEPAVMEYMDEHKLYRDGQPPLAPPKDS